MLWNVNKFSPQTHWLFAENLLLLSMAPLWHDVPTTAIAFHMFNAIFSRFYATCKNVQNWNMWTITWRWFQFFGQRALHPTEVVDGCLQKKSIDAIIAKTIFWTLNSLHFYIGRCKGFFNAIWQHWCFSFNEKSIRLSLGMDVGDGDWVQCKNTAAKCGRGRRGVSKGINSSKRNVQLSFFPES